MNVIGLDIGGANLKASDGNCLTRSMEFPLWKQPDQLAGAIKKLLQPFPPASRWGVTMTGELADCFPTRAVGVRSILDAVSTLRDEQDVLVWQTSGEFVSLEEAREFPALTAAANWHALATWAGRMAPAGPALVIDIGSTTTDIIPLEGGIPVPRGRTDLERLASGELVYLGVRRTPVASLITDVTLWGEETGIARELFATTLDAHLWLGHLAEEPLSRSPANGKPCTSEAAGDRLARMVCADRDLLSSTEIQQIAEAVHRREIALLSAALKKVLSRMKQPQAILLTGEGEFLARQLLEIPRSRFPCEEQIFLGDLLGSMHSQGACAYALARLAWEHSGEGGWIS